MLENLLALVKQEAQSAITNNPAVPNEKNDAAIADATQSVQSGLQNAVSAGGLSSVMALFSGAGSNLSSNPIVGSIISEFTNKLTANHGVPADQASGIASSLIPNVVSSLVNKTNDAGNSSFSLEGIVSSLTGNAGAAGAEGGIMNTLKNLI
jgi:hypothetical protein